MRQRKLAEKEAARLESQEKHDGNNNNDDDHSRVGAVDADDHPTAPAKSDGGATNPPGPDARPGSNDNDNSCSRKGEEEELTKHTPETRTAIYREMAEQKREKEERQKENLPKDRNFELEQVRERGEGIWDPRGGTQVCIWRAPCSLDLAQSILSWDGARRVCTRVVRGGGGGRGYRSHPHQRPGGEGGDGCGGNLLAWLWCFIRAPSVCYRTKVRWARQLRTIV